MHTYYLFLSHLFLKPFRCKFFSVACFCFFLAFTSFFFARPSIADPIDLTQPINLTPTLPTSPQAQPPAKAPSPQNSQQDSALFFGPILPQEAAIPLSTSENTAKPAATPLKDVLLEEALPAPIVEQSKVHITKDADVTVESAGLVDAQEQLGLPTESWHTTPREHIAQLLEGLPAQYQSPILHKLGRDFLSATLRVPPANDTPKDTNLLLLQADKLSQMGHSKEAYALLNSQRLLHTNPLYLKLHFEQEILRKHIKPACEMAAVQLKSNPSNYWEKAIILCQILEEKNDAANLSLSVLGESHSQQEQDFITTAQSILTPEVMANLSQLKAPDILSLILLNHAPTGIQEEIIKSLPSATRHQLILNLNPLKVEPAVQLQLLEEAVENYMLPGKALGEGYIYFGDGNTKLMKEWEKQDPASFIEKDTAAARAYLFIRTFLSPDDNRKYDYLSALLLNARKFHRLKAVSQALKEHLAQLKPQEGAPHIVHEIIPAIIYAGDFQSTCQWQNFVSQASPRKHFTTIPLLILACPSIDTSTQNQLLSQWYAELVQSFSHSLSDAHQYAESIFAILEVMGKAVPFKLWQQVGTRAPYQAVRLSLARKALIHDALSNKRMAEALAQILINFGNNPDLWSLDNLLYLLRKLQSLHQNDAATLLATEMIEALALPKK